MVRSSMVRSMIRRSLRRRQGMTEYIVIVGLVAILLVGAVTRFKDVIEVTIMGSAGRVGAVGDEMDGTGTTPSPSPSAPADGDSAGTRVGSGDPVFHDGAGGYRLADGTSVPASEVQP